MAGLFSRLHFTLWLKLSKVEAKCFFKIYQAGAGARPGIFWFLIISSHKQRLRPLGHPAPLATLSLPLYAAKCAFGLLEEYLLFVRLIGFDKSTTLSPTIDRANLFSTRDFFPRNSEKRNRACDSVQSTLIPVLDEKKSTSRWHW